MIYLQRTDRDSLMIARLTTHHPFLFSVSFPDGFISTTDMKCQIVSQCTWTGPVNPFNWRKRRYYDMYLQFSIIWDRTGSFKKSPFSFSFHLGSGYKSRVERTVPHQKEVNMRPRHMLTGSLLLAVAQASGLYPASTAPLKGINRSPRFGNERPLYTGFQPPVPQMMSYEAYNDIVASARSLGESK